MFPELLQTLLRGFARVCALSAQPPKMYRIGLPFFVARARQISAPVLQHGIVVVSPGREFPAAGGLISYGSSIEDAYSIAGGYTARILKGEKPSEMPVLQASKIELVINLEAANFSISSFLLADLGGEADHGIPCNSLACISGYCVGDARFIAALLWQHSPGDPRQFVGEGSRQHIGMQALHGANDPTAKTVLGPVRWPH
jgi:ABC transporter substrate binding protein